jgi:hypothetical protein
MSQDQICVNRRNLWLYPLGLTRVSLRVLCASVGTIRAKQSQKAVASSQQAAGGCTNKANSRAHGAKQSQFRGSVNREPSMCRRNASRRHYERGGRAKQSQFQAAGRPGSQEPVVQTKPIRGPRGDWRPGRPLYKQTQFALPAKRWAETALRARLPRQTKPISEESQVSSKRCATSGRAKQSQFAGRGLAESSIIIHQSPQTGTGGRA